MHRAIICLFFVTWIAFQADSQQLIFASATVGPTDQTAGAAISSDQFVAARFEVTSITEVTDIGGQFFTLPGGDDEMFAVIFKLDSISSLPTGDPFNADDLSRIVLSTTVNAPSTSSLDYIFPVSVTLQPGFYALIYGAGQFGASSTGGVAGAFGGESLSPDYCLWHSEGNGWADGGFPTLRLTVYGQAVPEPSAVYLLGFGAVLGVVIWSRRSGSG